MKEQFLNRSCAMPLTPWLTSFAPFLGGTCNSCVYWNAWFRRVCYLSADWRQFLRNGGKRLSL